METINGISVRYELTLFGMLINIKESIHDVNIGLYQEHTPHIDNAISLLATTDLKTFFCWKILEAAIPLEIQENFKGTVRAWKYDLQICGQDNYCNKNAVLCGIHKL